ncbi:MAG TPA: acetyl-CoA hydrolase/transferase C-terminal domain-containing protein [Spirochaetota bacterium]|nr:acetyl-CoA hydrolase/transferase C-terminal domain-containing protein [Spirochaetota bacterium]
MSFRKEYEKKIVTADEAVKIIKSGDVVHYGEFMMNSQLLDAALAKRKNELKDVEIRSMCCPFVPLVVQQDPDRKHFIFNDWHFSSASRKSHDKNLCNYIPITYHEVNGFFEKGYIKPDVAMIKVAPMDKSGFFNLSTSNSLTLGMCESSKAVIVEVNESVPKCLGGMRESIHISQVDYIVHGDNKQLLSLPETSSTDVDRKVAEIVMKEIPDRACLQLGIGAMPNIIGKMIAESDLQDLGIHTEMLVDSFVDMYNNGRITGKHKSIDKGKMVYTFAMGTQKLYDFLDNNPVCASYPVSYTNDPFRISQNDNVIAINNAVEVDLYGQVCSESSGMRQISGTGGQFDFIFGAYRSTGGKGFICLKSANIVDGKVISRIIPTLPAGATVTVPRSIASYVVTEYGIAMLKAKSTWQRAEELINIAHPAVRDDLVRMAEQQKIWVRRNKLTA